jgi:hypothetical protein
MTVAIVTMVGLAVAVLLICELYERREERLERLNRESWEIYRASRRIHDETAQALQDMFEEARSNAKAPLSHEIDR